MAQFVSIKNKIMTVIMLASTTALAVTIAAFMIYDLVTFRQNLQHNLETQAEIIAQNSTGALAYTDEKNAREVLDSLRAEPHIVAAALYDAQGKLFVQYPADISAPTNLAALLKAPRFERTHLTLFEPVEQSGLRLGTLYLKSDLRAISTRLELYGGISVLILSGSLLVVFWVSNTLQRRISDPIIKLAEIARKISTQQNFSGRAQKTSDDELGFLTDAFNQMLDRIETQTKDAALLAAIVQSSDDAIISMDLTGKITSWNRGAEKLYGYTAGEIIGQTVLQLIPKDRQGEETNILARSARGERMEHFETVRLHKNGKPIDVLLTVSPVGDAEGKIIGASKISRDITQRKRAEQELKRARDEAVAASRAKDDFLAALSHELRTPLNPVLLLSSEASENKTLSPELRQTFETISKNISLEARLIDDLLDLTRITRDKLALDLQATDVHAVLQNALETVRADIEFKHLAVTLALDAEKFTVMGDAVRLQQIFWNVLKNAMKFTPPSGTISIQTQSENDRLVVRITDTGIGMTPEEINRVFSAFAQGDHAAGGGSHRFGGLGLGLAISQKLLQLHSGKIEADSRGRDQGATFLIELPLLVASEIKSVPNNSPPVATAAALAAPGRHILLVEDHEPTRLALSLLLGRRNFEVFGAANMAEARKLAATEKIDFVISDIGLPDGNGYALMAELRDRHQLKGIALTGYGMEEDVARGRDAGFITHLTKPVHIHALENALALAGTKS